MSQSAGSDLPTLARRACGLRVAGGGSRHLSRQQPHTSARGRQRGVLRAGPHVRHQRCARCSALVGHARIERLRYRSRRAERRRRHCLAGATRREDSASWSRWRSLPRQRPAVAFSRDSLRSLHDSRVAACAVFCGLGGLGDVLRRCGTSLHGLAHVSRWSVLASLLIESPCGTWSSNAARAVGSRRQHWPARCHGGSRASITARRSSRAWGRSRTTCRSSRAAASRSPIRQRRQRRHWNMARRRAPRPSGWMMVEEVAEGGDVLAERVRRDPGSRAG